MHVDFQVTRALPLAFAVAILGSSGLWAEAPIPPRLYSEERAAVFQVDRETLAARFEDERRRCREAPGDAYEERATCGILEGLIRGFSGELEAGLEALEEAGQIFEEHHDGLGVSLTRFMAAEVNRQVGNREAAVAAYGEALAEIEALEKSNETVGLESFLIFFRLADMPEPLLDQFRVIGPQLRPLIVGMAGALVRDGFAALLLELDRVEEAEKYVTQALERSRALFGLFDAELLDRLGKIRQRQDRLEEARDLYSEALTAAERLGKTERQLHVLGRKAEVESFLGLADEAIASLEKARSLAHDLGDLGRSAETLADLSEMHFHYGRVEKAQQLIGEALALADRSQDPWSKIVTSSTAGCLALYAGSYEKAARHYETALLVLGGLESWRDEVEIFKISVLSTLTEVYYLLGRKEQLAEKLERIRELAAEMDFSEAEALAEVFEAVDRLIASEGDETSLEQLRQALRRLREILHSSSVLALRHLDLPTLRELERLAPSAGPADQDPAKRPVGKDPSELLPAPIPFLPEALRMIGEVKEAGDAGRFDRALDILGELLIKTRQADNREFEAFALTGLAGCHWRLEDRESAIAAALEAIDVFEGLLSDVRIDDLLTSYLGSDRHWIYDMAVLLLHEAGEVEKALEVAERSRARALLHRMGNPRLRVRDDSAWLRRLEDLRREIVALEGRPEQAERVRAKRAEYDDLIIRAKLERPEYAGLVRVEPIDLEALQKRWLPPETNLVAYHVVQGRVLVWVVDRESIQSLRLSLKPSDLEAAGTFAPLRGVGPQRGSVLLAAENLDRLDEALFDKLIREILPLARHDQWILVPHRELHSVPFAALEDSETGRRLVEMKQLAYAPSASVLRFLQTKESPFEGRVLVLGDATRPPADLPWARREAQAVASLFGEEPWLGDQASERRLLQSGGSVDLLHLAVHGVYRPLTPRFSHLLLAAGDGEDGRLEVEELFSRLDLRGVNLVVLSACRTAVGEQTLGDEIVGLTRAFLYAGTPAVVSTLWRVDDRATSFLMEKFYTALLGGVSYAEALRAAQLATRAEEGWSDPYYWAAFRLTGAPGLRWPRIDEWALCRRSPPVTPLSVPEWFHGPGGAASSSTF